MTTWGYSVLSSPFLKNKQGVYYPIIGVGVALIKIKKMKLKVTKTTIPTQQEKELISQGKMMARTTQSMWMFLMNRNVAANKILKAVCHSIR